MTGKLEIGEKLSVVNGQKPLCGLDLHNHEFLDEQIQTKACVDPDIPVANRQSHLTLDQQIAAFQLRREALIVNGLQQSRTKRGVYHISCIDDRPGHLIVSQRRLNNLRVSAPLRFKLHGLTMARIACVSYQNGWEKFCPPCRET